MSKRSPANARILRRHTAVCCIALACSGSSVAWGRQQVGFRAEVDLVLLHVAVIDPRGGEVPPLTAEDFSVFDDDTRQEIALFVTPSDAPLDVAMVLDSSSSMKPVESSARRAAVTFLNRMGLDDCIYVLPFADASGPGRWGRSGDPELRAFIGSIHASGGTALHDAVLAGLGELERANANDLVEMAAAAEADEGGGPAERAGGGSLADDRVPPHTGPPAGGATDGSGMVLPPRRTSLLDQVDSAIRGLDLSTPPPLRGCGEPLAAGEMTTASNARRKALLLLSDGADMDSAAGFYDALGAARAASVPVFPVAMGYANSEPGLKEHLAEIARATGGRMIENTQPRALADSFDEVVALLRSYYLIGFDPGTVAPGEGRRPRWHDVRVELRRPNFEPLVRPGYYR